ncbi:MAG: preprotein translocase subunit SecG [Gammaproteobacteria bacterium]
MYQVIIVIHVLLGLGIIGLVLMQQGKGADAGAAFGAGASGSVFGAQGAASFLSRSTAILATLFFLTSLGLAIMNSQKGVAYDLMSDTPSEKETPVLPDVDAAKKEDAVVKPEVESAPPAAGMAPTVTDVPSDSAAPEEANKPAEPVKGETSDSKPAEKK